VLDAKTARRVPAVKPARPAHAAAPNRRSTKHQAASAKRRFAAALRGRPGRAGRTARRKRRAEGLPRRIARAYYAALSLAQPLEE